MYNNRKGFATIFVLILVLSVILSAAGCNASTDEAASANKLDAARESVIDLWKNHAEESGTAKAIEDTYKQFPDDDVIKNIYFYSVAKSQYAMYLDFDKESYLETATEYAAKIDPDYQGEFADAMHKLVDNLIPKATQKKANTAAMSEEEKYNSLTNSEKKAICDYIQDQYDYYDKLEGGYAGDKYSDEIFEKAAKKYGLSDSHLSIIWMNYYSY